MVKIKLVTGAPSVTDIVPETMTIREFLEKHGVNYSIGTNSLDGIALNTQGLDATFAEHNVTDRAIVASLPNKDNAAQAIVVGNSCVIKSTLSPEEIKRIKKFHPEMLVMYDDDNEPVFAVDIDEEQPGSITNNGACFSGTTSSDGKATITILLDPAEGEYAELVYEKLGCALLRLEETENHLSEIIPELDNEEHKIRSMIVRM